MAVAETGRTILNAGVKITTANWGFDKLTAGKPPVMSQIAGVDGKAPKEFAFPFRPLPIQFEGFGFEVSELERPFNTPIVNVKSGKLRKFNFEVPLSVFADSITESIDDNDLVLRQIAEDAIPVKFVRMPGAILASQWYLTDLTMSVDRTTISGANVKTTATLSFIEFENYQKRFLYLQPVSYGLGGKTTPSTGTPPGGETGAPPLDAEALKQLMEARTGAGRSGRGNP